MDAIKKSGERRPLLFGSSFREGDGKARYNTPRTISSSSEDDEETARLPVKIFNATQTMPSIHKRMSPESEGRKMAPSDGFRRNEKELSMDGAGGSQLDETSNLEGCDACIPEVPAQKKQSTNNDVAGTAEARGILRLHETPRNILAGCDDLFENWEPRWVGSGRNHSDLRANDSHTPQDSLECQPDVRYTALLERNHEEPNSGFYSARKDNNRGDERSRKELKNEQFKEAFDKENLVQRLCRLFGPHRQDKGNHEACVSGIFPRVCGEYKPNYRYISPHWHGYLP